MIFKDKMRCRWRPWVMTPRKLFNSAKCIYFLLPIMLLLLPTEAVVEDYKNKYDNYDDYVEYDSMDDDNNYAGLGPTAYDYDDKSEAIAKSKKSTRDANEVEVVSQLAHNDPKKQSESEAPAVTSAPITHAASSEIQNRQTNEANPNPSPLAPECGPAAYFDKAFQAPRVNNDQSEKAKELRDLVQHLYISQARVQLEASEIKKAQAIANEAQQQLEEAANHVRAVTAALQNSQQEVATSAIRAQTAQLQLAAHDQLLFAARQDVDALSSRMVGLQAAEGIAQPQVSFDIGALMQKLRQPLMDADKPTPVPSIAVPNQLKENTPAKTPSEFFYDDEYEYY